MKPVFFFDGKELPCLGGGNPSHKAKRTSLRQWAGAGDDWPTGTEVYSKPISLFFLRVLVAHV